MSLVVTLPADALEALEARITATILASVQREERWLSDKDIAHRCSVDKRTATRWRLESGLPYVKVRGAARVKLSDLEAFLAPAP